MPPLQPPPPALVLGSPSAARRPASQVVFVVDVGVQSHCVSDSDGCVMDAFVRAVEQAVARILVYLRSHVDSRLTWAFQIVDMSAVGKTKRSGELRQALDVSLASLLSLRGSLASWKEGFVSKRPSPASDEPRGDRLLLLLKKNLADVRWTRTWSPMESTTTRSVFSPAKLRSSAALAPVSVRNCMFLLTPFPTSTLELGLFVTGAPANPAKVRDAARRRLQINTLVDDIQEKLLDSHVWDKYTMERRTAIYGVDTSSILGGHLPLAADGMDWERDFIREQMSAIFSAYGGRIIDLADLVAPQVNSAHLAIIRSKSIDLRIGRLMKCQGRDGRAIVVEAMRQQAQAKRTIHWAGRLRLSHIESNLGIDKVQTIPSVHHVKDFSSTSSQIPKTDSTAWIQIEVYEVDVLRRSNLAPSLSAHALSIGSPCPSIFNQEAATVEALVYLSDIDASMYSQFDSKLYYVRGAPVGSDSLKLNQDERANLENFVSLTQILKSRSLAVILLFQIHSAGTNDVFGAMAHDSGSKGALFLLMPSNNDQVGVMRMLGSDQALIEMQKSSTQGHAAAAHSSAYLPNRLSESYLEPWSVYPLSLGISQTAWPIVDRIQSQLEGHPPAYTVLTASLRDDKLLSPLNSPNSKEGPLKSVVKCRQIRKTQIHNEFTSWWYKLLYTKLHTLEEMVTAELPEWRRRFREVSDESGYVETIFRLVFDAGQIEVKWNLLKTIKPGLSVESSMECIGQIGEEEGRTSLAELLRGSSEYDWASVLQIGKIWETKLQIALNLEILYMQRNHGTDLPKIAELDEPGATSNPSTYLAFIESQVDRLMIWLSIEHDLIPASFAREALSRNADEGNIEGTFLRILINSCYSEFANELGMADSILTENLIEPMPTVFVKARKSTTSRGGRKKAPAVEKLLEREAEKKKQPKDRKPAFSTSSRILSLSTRQTKGAGSGKDCSATTEDSLLLPKKEEGLENAGDFSQSKFPRAKSRLKRKQDLQFANRLRGGIDGPDSPIKSPTKAPAFVDNNLEQPPRLNRANDSSATEKRTLVEDTPAAPSKKRKLRAFESPAQGERVIFTIRATPEGKTIFRIPAQKPLETPINASKDAGFLSPLARRSGGSATSSMLAETPVRFVKETSLFKEQLSGRRLFSKPGFRSPLRNSGTSVAIDWDDAFGELGE